MQKIVTNTWYDGDAEAAVDFYVSLFPDAAITGTVPYVEDAHGAPGQTMVVDFELAGQAFTAIDGDDSTEHGHAMSPLVNCDGQEGVDRCWEAILADGGKEVECGWIAGKWGVHWRIRPSEADRCLGGEDEEAAVRAARAMCKMKKIDLQGLKDAPTKAAPPETHRTGEAVKATAVRSYDRSPPAGTPEAARQAPDRPEVA